MDMHRNKMRNLAPLFSEDTIYIYIYIQRFGKLMNFVPDDLISIYQQLLRPLVCDDAVNSGIALSIATLLGGNLSRCCQVGIAIRWEANTGCTELVVLKPGVKQLTINL